MQDYGEESTILTWNIWRGKYSHWHEKMIGITVSGSLQGIGMTTIGLSGRRQLFHQVVSVGTPMTARGGNLSIKVGAQWENLDWEYISITLLG